MGIVNPAPTGKPGQVLVPDTRPDTHPVAGRKRPGWWDVVIVGAGPGGGAAANGLAGSGLRVLVLERHPMPRDKACGGALPAGNTLVDETVPVEARSTRIVTLRDGRPLGSFERPHHPILLTRRRDMDLALVQRALDCARGSMHLRDGIRVTSVEETRNCVRVHLSDGTVETARHVIGADGVAGVAARVPGLRRKGCFAVAVDVEVAVDPVRYPLHYERSLFDWYCLPGGYGWIFPKNGYLSCGVIRWPRAGDLRAEARRFLHRHLAGIPVRELRQAIHPVPGYDGNHAVATDRILLVGDAARLVDPVIGEGIRHALVSGRLAAEAIIEETHGASASQSGGADPCSALSAGKRYQAAVGERVAPWLDPVRRLGVITFLQAPDLFCRALQQDVYTDHTS
jgi:geranylgeranyl reductase family protein